MEAAKKMEWITAALAAGRSVYVHSCTRVFKITPAIAKRFDKAGRPVFKITGTSLYMSNGNRYDCINFNPLTAE